MGSSNSSDLPVTTATPIGGQRSKIRAWLTFNQRGRPALRQRLEKISFLHAQLEIEIQNYVGSPDALRKCAVLPAAPRFCGETHNLVFLVCCAALRRNKTSLGRRDLQESPVTGGLPNTRRAS